MAQLPLIAGVELGGTKCIAVLSRGPDAILEEVRVPTTRPEETLPALEAALDQWRGFAAIGVASFGPVSIDPHSGDYGKITSTPKPHWANTDVARRLGARYGVPVGFHSDVVGAALAEARWGAGQGLPDLAYVTVGTGVGAGMIAHGRPVDGLTHSEFGHIRPPRVAGDDWIGACPYHGACVEGLAAGPAIAARTGIKGEDLGADHPAWETVIGALSTLFATLTLTGVPRRIVLGGGVMVGNPWLLPRLRAATAANLNGYVALPEVTDMDTFLVPAALGGNAGPLGAVLLGALAVEDRLGAALAG
ncbi:ROK family protein [Sphingomonas sp. RRHST34]|jgi:fructokinase|uniref:fructokinase n=1 Tax=Sphingomonas citri TaxID=2862499 RepID=A0ABS7BIG3_9SPHN|nr:ROK family protein [Sphingomonas citri]MBW6529398.1 ROK family protein [Sphingomonas citri]